MSRFIELDQFLTKPATAKRCWDWFHEHIEVPANAVYIEPSAGLRAFYDLMPKDRRRGFELDPELVGDGVQHADFLELLPLDSPLPDGPPLYFVGNPPFGERGALAVKFINAAFSLGAEAVGFIVPLSGAHADTRFCVETKRWELEPDCFVFPDGGQADVMGCVFVIFKKRGLGKARTKRTCGDYAWVRRVNMESPASVIQARDCACYLPDSFYHNKPPELVYKPEDIRYGSGFGIEIRNGHDRAVMRVLKRIDWVAQAKPSPNGVLHLTRTGVSDAIVAAGFVDGREPSCGSYVEIKTISNYNGGKNLHLKDQCDFFLPSTLFESKGDMFRAHDEFCLNQMYGIIAKQDRAEVLAALRAFDWRAAAKASPNHSLGLSPAIIRRAVASCGFVDPY